MSKIKLSEEELVRLRKLYKRRNELRAEFKIDFFVPNNGGQKAFFENADKKRRDIFGGNRWGKSTCGVIEDISWVLGERRFYPADNPLRRLGIPRRGVKGLVIAQTWDKVDELFTGEGFGSSPKGKIREYCPARCITNTWKDNQGRTTRMAFRSVIDGVQRDSLLYFATVQSFLRNEMGLESSDWDFIHVDEPLPRDMQVAVSRGLVDRDGSMWRLLTPIEEMWMWDEAVMQSTAHPDYYWIYTGKAGENSHLKGMDAFYETLSEEIDGIAKALPALTKAHKVQKKVSKVGFDFENINEAIKKIEEEINEVLDVYKSNNREKIINEVGDLLFACVNVARLLNVDEEEALNKSTKKFVKRFNFIEESIVNQGKSLSESTIDEMNALWEDSKKYD
mgnify:CR=1 FL=1